MSPAAQRGEHAFYRHLSGGGGCACQELSACERAEVGGGEREVQELRKAGGEAVGGAEEKQISAQFS